MIPRVQTSSDLGIEPKRPIGPRALTVRYNAIDKVECERKLHELAISQGSKY